MSEAIRVWPEERLEGVTCRCGGEVYFENLYKRGKATKESAWEAYCHKCMACDPNGYSSRKKLLAESPGFWKGDAR
jgi:hypothetical protein